MPSISMLLRGQGIPSIAFLLLLLTAGCARYTCAPDKGFHEAWVANGESFPAIPACMTAIWDVGTCAVETPAIADQQIKWALKCVAYCKRASKTEKIKACTGVSMNQDHGRPLCKRIPRTPDMPPIENPWYIICSDISATCKCLPIVKKKK